MQLNRNRPSRDKHIHFGDMKNECLQPAMPAESIGATLKSVWRVNANPSYNNASPSHSPTQVIIRTLAGAGEILIQNQAPSTVVAGSILLFNQLELLQYRCCASRWDFFWFRFEPLTTSLLPVNKPILLPDTEEESCEREQILREVRNPSSGYARLASTRFSLMLGKWASTLVAENYSHPHRRRIEQTVEEMKQRIGQNWTLPEMACWAGLGERRFRQVFKEITGSPPKQFYDRLRLEQARSLVQNKLCNVGEAAEQLGFSSPFHLSKAFKKQFGIPPSQIGDANVG